MSKVHIFSTAIVQQPSPRAIMSMCRVSEFTPSAARWPVGHAGQHVPAEPNTNPNHSQNQLRFLLPPFTSTRIVRFQLGSKVKTSLSCCPLLHNAYGQTPYTSSTQHTTRTSRQARRTLLDIAAKHMTSRDMAHSYDITHPRQPIKHLTQPQQQQQKHKQQLTRWPISRHLRFSFRVHTRDKQANGSVGTRGQHNTTTLQPYPHSTRARTIHMQQMGEECCQDCCVGLHPARPPA